MVPSPARINLLPDNIFHNKLTLNVPNKMPKMRAFILFCFIFNFFAKTFCQ